jgi:DNA replication protein DnaC
MTHLPTPEVTERVAALLTGFKLPLLAAEVVRRFEQAGHENAIPVLLETLEAEQEARNHRRCDRLRRASRLPPGKTFETLDEAQLGKGLARQLRQLQSGDFIEEAGNVLCFGLPGRGKTHAACALGDAMVQKGHSVLFTPAFRVVQELLAAKRDLTLPRALRKLDNFDVIILDDIGYVQQTGDEVDVLFTLLAERYERRSLIITSNLVFSEWEQIFKSPMTTEAAIDRLVHHATILEFGGVSVRAETAKRRKHHDS